MKYLILLILSLLVFACSNGKRVYWCGDHACINNKEKEAYFKKTMIVEIRELSKQNKKSKSELEIIKKQAGLEQKKEIKNEKELAKQVRLDKKRRIKEEKELAKQVRLDKKRRIKEERELTKQVRLEEKKIIKEEKKSYKKKILKTENVSLEKEVIINTGTARINISSTEFKELVEKITKKNMFKPYPNINAIPN